jgi:hypothetical protein
MLLGSVSVCEVPLCAGPNLANFLCIGSPVPNANTRLMIIDLAGQIDSNIQEIIGLTALEQPGVPESASFFPLSRNICRSPSNGASQAVATYLESFTLPITLEIEVYTVNGTFYTFRTC